MTQTIQLLITEVSNGLARENRLLQRGRVNDALQQSENRAALLSDLEQELASLKTPIPPHMTTAIKTMLELNAQNAQLLQAALAGFVAAKEQIYRTAPSAGYDADGRRVYPVEANTKRRM